MGSCADEKGFGQNDPSRPSALRRADGDGSCLADHLADIMNEVFIYARSPEVVESFNKHNRNPKYLTGACADGRPPC